MSPTSLSGDKEGRNGTVEAWGGGQAWPRSLRSNLRSLSVSEEGVVVLREEVPLSGCAESRRGVWTPTARCDGCRLGLAIECERVDRSCPNRLFPHLPHVGTGAECARSHEPPEARRGETTSRSGSRLRGQRISLVTLTGDPPALRRRREGLDRAKRPKRRESESRGGLL